MCSLNVAKGSAPDSNVTALRTVGLGIPEEERRRARHTSILALLQADRDLRGVGVGRETGLEDGHIQSQGLRMPHQRFGL
jgi:hypothetical protein